MEALMGGHNLEPAADEDQKNLQEQRDEKYGHSPPVLRHHSSLEMYQDETQLNFSFDWDQRILLFPPFHKRRHHKNCKSDPVSFFDAHFQKGYYAFICMGLWLYGQKVEVDG